MAILILVAIFMLLSIVVVLLRKTFAHWCAPLGVGLALYIVYLCIIPFVTLPEDYPYYSIKYFLSTQFPVMAWALFYFFGMAAGIVLYRAVTTVKTHSCGLTFVVLGIVGLVASAIMMLTLPVHVGRLALPMDYQSPAHPYYVVFGLCFALAVFGVVIIIERLLDISRGIQWLRLLGQHSLFGFVFQWCVVQTCSILVSLKQPSDAVRWLLVPTTMAITTVGVYLETALLARWKAKRQPAAGRAA